MFNPLVPVLKILICKTMLKKSEAVFTWIVVCAIVA